MAGVDVTITVEDEFSQALDKFNEMYDRCSNSLSDFIHSSGSAEKNMSSLGDSSSSASLGIGKAGLGGAFLILNQALQVFERISARVIENLDDIGDKQRSFIIFGKEAGAEFNTFAKNIAYSLGRAEGEVRKAGHRFARLGIGGNEIKDLTMLADRFANLNPDKSFGDVISGFEDAIKGRSASGLSDLLGGGEFVEQKIERSHIDRYLKRGDVSGAMDKFKEVADSLGYTQDKADQFSMTLDKKIQGMTERVKNYVVDMISDVISVFEPFVDKIMDWMNNDDVRGFFEGLKEEVTMAASAVAALLDTIIDGWSQIYDIAKPAFDWIGELVNKYLPWISEESMGLVDKLTMIIVGGVSAIFYGIVELVQHALNIIVTGIETDINWILGVCEDFANGAIGIANWIRDGIIDIVSNLVGFIAGLVEDLADTDLGEMLGITSAADSIHQIMNDLEEAKKNGFEEISLKRVNLDEYKVDPIDSVKMTAEAIDGAIKKVHGFFDKSIDAQSKDSDETNDSLNDINTGVGQIVSMGQREQDLRWLKEMAEQKAINEINLRQLTPTINLQVRGVSGQSPNDYAKSLAAELQRMADAGTFNAYGNVG